MPDTRIGAPVLALKRKILPCKSVTSFTEQPPFHPEIFTYWSVLTTVSVENLTKLYDILLPLPLAPISWLTFLLYLWPWITIKRYSH